MTQTEKKTEAQNKSEKEKLDEEFVESSPVDPTEEQKGQSHDKEQINSIVRFQKTIVFDETKVSRINQTIVNPKFYNSFNYSLLPNERPMRKMTLGISSPHRGDGKTLVASNLAVSLALSTESDVVLVDLNILNPKLNEIFETPLSPGFLESINEPTIRVVPTKIGNLSILTAGNIFSNALHGLRLGVGDNQSNQSHVNPSIGLEQMAEFRNILYTLQERFDLVIVDFPSVDESKALTMFMKQLDSIIVVINTGKTKKEDIDKMLTQLNENQIRGFVFNRTPSEK